ncbi:MAG: YmaF family protein [Lachnospiraceae bacterium]|nr:YmaF family protein [Lachnospiraceae bacterium]
MNSNRSNDSNTLYNDNCENCNENRCNDTNCDVCEANEVSAANRRNQEHHNTDWNHVHEVTGSTETVTECEECHNHRFCTVSSKAMRMGNSHVHEVKFCTDTADGHSHEFCDKTSTAIEVGGGKHVHYLNDRTESEDNHVHRFQAATLIESPTDFKCED